MIFSWIGVGFIVIFYLSFGDGRCGYSGLCFLFIDFYIFG